jgi:hypothetical protein
MVMSPQPVGDSSLPKSAQFYLDFTDSTFSGLIEELMSRLLNLGFRVGAVAVSGAARPRMVIGETIYAGIEAIRHFVEALEQLLALPTKA